MASQWINVILGIWLIVSPFILGFSENAAATWNNIIIGIVVAALALWAALGREATVVR